LSNNIKNSIWLIGPGNIGKDYVKVLKQFNLDVTVIGRSEKKSFPLNVFGGGLESYINKSSDIPKYAIVAVNESELYSVTKILLENNVKNILIEKPGSLSKRELLNLNDMVVEKNSNVYIGYNRRFYQSVQKCKELLKDNNEPLNVHFEFTEWTHDIDFKHYKNSELEKFFLCNSSHVSDLVFHLFGEPKYLDSHTSGGLDWHPASSVFSGSGKTVDNVLFSYNANWSSAGRWGIEINLTNYKLILKPLEKLFIQKKGCLDTEEIKIDSELDNSYKPGLYSQVKDFLDGDNKYLCSLSEQINNFKWYYKIANYKE
jgi:predicted dehydrogenase